MVPYYGQTIFIWAAFCIRIGLSLTLRYNHYLIYVYNVSVRYAAVLTKHELASRIYVVKESSKYKTAENSIQWKQSCIVRTEDRPNNVKSCFAQILQPGWKCVLRPSFHSLLTLDISASAYLIHLFTVFAKRRIKRRTDTPHVLEFGAIFRCNFPQWKKLELTNINGIEQDRTHNFIQF